MSNSEVLGRIDALVKWSEEISLVSELALRHAERQRRDLLELRATLAATETGNTDAILGASAITSEMLGAVKS